MILPVRGATTATSDAYSTLALKKLNRCSEMEMYKALNVRVSIASSNFLL